MSITHDENGVPVTAAELNGVMDIDHVIEVLPTGHVRPRADIYAPTLHQEEIESGAGWEPIRGYSGQYFPTAEGRAKNFIMHNSEFIGGRLADDILSRPGIYVVVVATWDPDEEDDDDDGETLIEGWAVLYQEA